MDVDDSEEEYESCLEIDGETDVQNFLLGTFGSKHEYDRVRKGKAPQWSQQPPQQPLPPIDLSISPIGPDRKKRRRVQPGSKSAEHQVQSETSEIEADPISQTSSSTSNSHHHNTRSSNYGSSAIRRRESEENVLIELKLKEVRAKFETRNDRNGSLAEGTKSSYSRYQQHWKVSLD